MASRRHHLWAVAFGVWASLAVAPAHAGRLLGPRPASAPAVKLPVPLESLPEAARKVVQQPTLTARAPAEEFTSRPELYRWLLDHPDRTSLAWRRLGVPCMPIEPRHPGEFGYADEGTDVHWRVVASGPAGRVWFAEGHAKPGPMLPTVPVKMVAVLRHDLPEGDDAPGPVRQEVEVFLLTDSRAAALVAKLLGPAGPRMAEQGASQLLLFFSGIARYCERHPDEVRRLLGPKAE
jgi:hypothetical protein